MNSNNLHQTEIETSRVGGFGGSDAAMFLRIAKNGGLTSETDKRRIKVAKGEIPFSPLPQTAAMKAGHAFEDWYYSAEDIRKNLERETRIEVPLAKNFKTFAHADFCENQCIWELKFSQKNIFEIGQTYEAQLQWYYLLGASRVYLVAGSGEVEPFNVEKVNTIEIEPNEHTISELRKGVRLLDSIWSSKIELGETVEAEDLLPFEQEAFSRLSLITRQIKELEAEQRWLKEDILKFMDSQEIRSINNNICLCTYVAGSKRSTLDTELLTTLNPQIKLSDYQKITEVKPSIKITLKKA